MKLQNVRALGDVTGGWVLTSHNGSLMLTHAPLDSSSSFCLDKTQFVSERCKYRSEVLSSICKILEPQPETIFIDEEAEAVIAEIIAANRLLF